MVTDEHFDKVTQALIMRLRQLEETAEQEGVSLFRLLFVLFLVYSNSIVINSSTHLLKPIL